MLGECENVILKIVKMIVKNCVFLLTLKLNLDLDLNLNLNFEFLNLLQGECNANSKRLAACK